MKKVLYLITKSNWGGAQKYVFDLATTISTNQFEVIVAAGGTGAKGAEAGQLASKLAGANIPFYPIKSFTRDIFLLNEPRTFWEVGKLIYQERPDILHVNSSKAAGVGGFIGRLLGVKKIIYTVHGWPFNEDRNSISRASRYFFSWLTCVFSHKIIVLNQTDLTQGQRMWFVDQKMHLIYNGILPINFLSREEAREKLKIEKNDLVIGSIAELHSNKNLDLLIEAVRQTPGWKLAIIGEGEDRNRLETLVKKYSLQDRVLLPGFVANAATYLKAFDVFALVSKKEGLPYVILEAGLAGLPVIGSNIPGIIEIIGNDYGIIVDTTKNEQTIAEALETISTNKTLSSTLATNLQHKVETNFSLEKMTNYTVSLY